ncbi:MAG TPA: carboxypeptidase-like regulatory domain-containing protein [Bacteroidia bacterium]|jgi:hypothetical protein|nr:carboxypeptidase-like regulatory domain-containing protein [Bacteroidia bacterium]
MRKVKYLFSGLFFLTVVCCKAQFTGLIKDKKTGQPLAFVNIGILHKNIGTVCDEHGAFTLNTNFASENDTIKIFQLGYIPLQETVKNFLLHHAANAVIYLEQASILLKETVIKPKKEVKRILGNTENTEAVILYFPGNMLGSEIGVQMHTKKNRLVFLEELRFNIAELNLDSVQFRVNIYAVKNNLPDSNVLAHPLYVTYKKNTGPLLVDVKNLKLYLNGDFFVSLEWIKGSSQNALRFCAGLINTHSLVRPTSEGSWKKSSAGAGFSCKVTSFE